MVERIMEMTSENLNIDRALIQPTSSFKGDLGIDSLDLFELVMALEEEFDVEIPTEDLEKLSTVQDVADYADRNHRVTWNTISDHSRWYGLGGGASSCCSCIRGRWPGTDRSGKRTGGMGAGTDSCRKKSDGAAVRCEYYADEPVCR